MTPLVFSMKLPGHSSSSSPEPRNTYRLGLKFPASAATRTAFPPHTWSFPSVNVLVCGHEEDPFIDLRWLHTFLRKHIFDAPGNIHRCRTNSTRSNCDVVERSMFWTFDEVAGSIGFPYSWRFRMMRIFSQRHRSESLNTCTLRLKCSKIGLSSNESFFQ